MPKNIVTEDVFVEVVNNIKEDIKQNLLNDFQNIPIDSKIVSSLVDKALLQIFDTSNDLSELISSVVFRQIKKLDISSIVSEALGESFKDAIGGIRSELNYLRSSIVDLNNVIGSEYDPGSRYDPGSSLKGRINRLEKTVGVDTGCCYPNSHMEIIERLVRSINELNDRLIYIEKHKLNERGEETN